MSEGAGEKDFDPFVEHQSKRMMSFALYGKVKSLVDSWNREERAKARIIVLAMCGLLAWLAAIIVGAIFFPRYAGLLVPIGFLAWVVYVVGLIWKHLSAPRRG